MSLSTRSNNQVPPEVMISSSWADEVEETEFLTSSNLTSPVQTKSPENNFPKGPRNNFSQGYNKNHNSYQSPKKPEPRTILKRENGSNFTNKEDQHNLQKNLNQVSYRKKSQEILPMPTNQNRLSSSAPNHSRSFKNKFVNNSIGNSPPKSEYSKQDLGHHTKLTGISGAKTINGSGYNSNRWVGPEEDNPINGSKDHKSRNNESYAPNRNVHNNFSKNNLRGGPGHSSGDFFNNHKDIQEESCNQHIKGPEATRWNAAESALQNIGNAIKQNETNTCILKTKKSETFEVEGVKNAYSPHHKKGLGYRSTCRLEWVNCPKDVSYVDVLTLYGDFKDEKTISVSYSPSNTLYLLFITPDDAELAIRRHTLMARVGNLRRIPQIESPRLIETPIL